MEREENLIAAFSFFDKDGSGYITSDELQQACRDFGLGDVHLDEMIKEIDQDNVSHYSVILSINRSLSIQLFGSSFHFIEWKDVYFSFCGVIYLKGKLQVAEIKLETRHHTW